MFREKERQQTLNVFIYKGLFREEYSYDSPLLTRAYRRPDCSWNMPSVHQVLRRDSSSNIPRVRVNYKCLEGKNPWVYTENISSSETRGIMNLQLVALLYATTCNGIESYYGSPPNFSLTKSLEVKRAHGRIS